MQILKLKQLPSEQRTVLHVVTLMMAAWDEEVFKHSQQVAHELLSLAPHAHEEEWYWAGLLHDLGKITVASVILHKRSGLSRKERRLMEQHSMKGAAILMQIGAPQTVIDGAEFHHARWDGLGYPSNLLGDQIPLVARALAIADVYAALTSDRPYRHAYTPEQAQLEIERNAGSQFDPNIVARFFERESHVTR
jgi:putative nucleotidyltransferase with HDIG domain